MTTASDHAIHKGPICIDGLACNLSNPQRDRTLLDFFQVSIDPTNGAADIAYADDHATPGTAVLYFTRQCTGSSATTGAALVNDCVVPPPPVPLPPCDPPPLVDPPASVNGGGEVLTGPQSCIQISTVQNPAGACPLGQMPAGGDIPPGMQSGL